MSARFADDLLAVLGVQADRDLVAHGAAGHKQRSLAAEDFRGARFQAIDGRVFAVDIVAHLGCCHRVRMAGVGLVTVSLRRSMVATAAGEAAACSDKTAVSEAIDSHFATTRIQYELRDRRFGEEALENFIRQQPPLGCECDPVAVGETDEVFVFQAGDGRKKLADR